MLQKHVLDDVLTAALGTGGDFAEIFVEDKYSTSIELVGGKVENSVSGRDFGIGIRILNGEHYVYAHTNEHEKDKLIQLARRAAQAISGQQRDVTFGFIEPSISNRHPVLHHPQEVPKGNKIATLQEVYHAAKSYDPLISQAKTSYHDQDQRVQIANSEGVFVEDHRVRSRISVQSIAANEHDMQTGFASQGALQGFELFETLDLKAVGSEAARMAMTMLKADECPSGQFPVIIDNAYGGVIFHEACGHGLEATFVGKKDSVFADRIGEQIASSLVTYIDDGTLPNEWGSANIDDEGARTRRNVLIENGILKADQYEGS